MAREQRHAVVAAIARREWLLRMLALGAAGFWTHRVGNGPFRFVRYVPQTMIEFERNPDYYGAKSGIERVILKFVGEAALTELLAGNVDIARPRRCYHRPVHSLTRDVILRALRLLAERLPPSEPPVDLILVGGAAMVLLFGARESTKDVDAFSMDPEAGTSVAKAATHVAVALGLPDDWLSDAAKGYAHGLTLGPVLLETPTLRVRTTSAAQLLAMKLSAWRDDVDVEDARRLLQECRGHRDDIWQQVEQHVVPGRELKARYAFDDLWESEYGSA